MGKRGKRPRAARRERERDLRKLARDRERLFALSAGGRPERPIEVDSSAVIDVRAASTACPLCEGTLDVLEHAAVRVGDQPLRETRVKCRQCGVGRSLWFRIAPPRAN